MAHDPHSAPDQFCPPCDIGPFTRNAYWTGKLMLAADFVAEQDYLIEKLRHHNQRLHGWGVVCGLKVVQHETEACRNRFVCVESGSAIDCCGYDIVLREKDCIDLFAVPAIRALREAGDQDPHTLQVCIRYRECATEQIPVLYDECGCEDGRCAPNRILESSELDVLVLPAGDPAPPPPPPEDCGTLWTAALEGCPDCEQSDCVVLATIAGYVVDDALVDLPPGDPVPDGASRIDNLTGRRILPSPATIRDVIECLRHDDGSAPAPRLDLPRLDLPRLDLPRIVAINWRHGARDDGLRGTLDDLGLMIAFDPPVQAATLTEHSVQVLRRFERDPVEDEPQVYYYCNVRGAVKGVMIDADCGGWRGSADPTSDAVTGVQFRPLDSLGHEAKWPSGDYRVILEGDQILGVRKITIPDPSRPGGRIEVHPALDANHLAPGLGNEGARCPSGNGTEGGRFISWFTLPDEG